MPSLQSKLVKQFLLNLKLQNIDFEKQLEILEIQNTELKQKEQNILAEQEELRIYQTQTEDGNEACHIRRVLSLNKNNPGAKPNKVIILKRKGKEVFQQIKDFLNQGLKKEDRIIIGASAFCSMERLIEAIEKFNV
ncbi:Hypothetical_protein [Hexamita inflata]|uniref:Hypothetical_protein n=1 Tax=Hexamita inflata TaxID=28002 RepID=A0AA86Q0A8_9EUKA|nr:Hypothetical protein HINF_LOCUS35846 [Hexamita inflata]